MQCFSHSWLRRLVTALGLTLLVLVLPTGAPGAAPARGQPTLPDVDIILVLEVHDVRGWLQLHSEVLGTPREVPKPLGVSLAAGKGARRGLTISQPKFSTEVSLAQGVRSFKVVVTGKIPGGEALAALPAFEQAVLAVQAGSVDSELTLAYGLSAVNARLAEMYLTRS